MKQRPIALLAGAVAIALVGVGCGGGGDDSTSSAALTKKEFLKQGNAICSAGNEEIESAFEELVRENGRNGGKLPPALVAEWVVTVVIPSIDRQIGDLRDLTAPNEERIEAILDDTEDALGEFEDDPTPLFVRGENPFNQANEELRDYGLIVCAES